MNQQWDCNQPWEALITLILDCPGAGNTSSFFPRNKPAIFFYIFFVILPFNPYQSCSHTPSSHRAYTIVFAFFFLRRGEK